MTPPRPRRAGGSAPPGAGDTGRPDGRRSFGLLRKVPNSLFGGLRSYPRSTGQHAGALPRRENGRRAGRPGAHGRERGRSGELSRGFRSTAKGTGRAGRRCSRRPKGSGQEERRVSDRSEGRWQRIEGDLARARSRGAGTSNDPRARKTSARRSGGRSSELHERWRADGREVLGGSRAPAGRNGGVPRGAGSRSWRLAEVRPARGRRRGRLRGRSSRSPRRASSTRRRPRSS